MMGKQKNYSYEKKCKLFAPLCALLHICYGVRVATRCMQLQPIKKWYNTVYSHVSHSPYGISNRISENLRFERKKKKSFKLQVKSTVG
jgi:hypothetical protein